MDGQRGGFNQPESNTEGNPRYCVFRSGSSWLAVPAVEVREVMPRPDMVFVPGTPESFIGLCHIRSEFIPVLNLKSVIAEHGGSNEKILLVLDDADGVWGFLIDEVASLQQLDISDAPETDDSVAGCAVIGWATFDGSVIQILDKTRMRNLAEQELAVIWQSTDPLERSGPRESTSLTSTIS